MTLLSKRFRELNLNLSEIIIHAPYIKHTPADKRTILFHKFLKTQAQNSQSCADLFVHFC
jgi:hypothetical protein